MLFLGLSIIIDGEPSNLIYNNLVRRLRRRCQGGQTTPSADESHEIMLCSWGPPQLQNGAYKRCKERACDCQSISCLATQNIESPLKTDREYSVRVKLTVKIFPQESERYRVDITGRRSNLFSLESIVKIAHKQGQAF